jgi:hypothetical protein
MSFLSQIPFGEVPAGWTAERWCEHLAHVAAACRPVNPQRADELERWAEAVRQRHSDQESE